MGEAEMARIAKLMAGVLRGEAEGRQVREEVRELAGGFPPYPG
jgi:glycine hydroxymethyltransferase